MTSVVSTAFWLPYNATKASVGIGAGLAYVGGCFYLRAVNSVVEGVTGFNVVKPINNAVSGLRLITK